MPVGIKGVVATIRTLKGSFNSHPRRKFGGLIVELSRHASLRVDNEGDIRDHLWISKRLFSGRGVRFLGYGERGVLGLVVDPGDGEGVGFPWVDTGESDVGVGAGCDVDVFGEVHCYAAGFSGHGVDAGVGEAFVGGPVEVDEEEHADGAFEGPEDDDCLDPRELREVGNLTVEPCSCHCYGCEDDVNVEKCLVKGMPDGREGLDSDEDHRDCTNSSPRDKGIMLDHLPHSGPSCSCVLDDGPSSSVNNHLDHDYPSDPSVHEVVGIEADLKKRDERVISTCKNYESDHIYYGHNPRSSTEFSND